MTTMHTIMPLDVVMDGYDDPSRLKPVMEVRRGGMLVQVEPVQPGIGKVVRLIECSLDDYLKPELSPGSLIYYGEDY